MRIDGLADFEFADGDDAAQDVVGRLNAVTRGSNGSDAFGFLLVDGLSMQEETIVSAIFRNLGTTALFGGSAGDGTDFGRTAGYHDGEFRSDCAVFTLGRTDHPFVVFKTEHFVPTDKKMVVTGAIPAPRQHPRRGHARRVGPTRATAARLPSERPDGYAATSALHASSE